MPLFLGIGDLSIGGRKLGVRSRDDAERLTARAITRNHRLTHLAEQGSVCHESFANNLSRAPVDARVRRLAPKSSRVVRKVGQGCARLFRGRTGEGIAFAGCRELLAHPDHIHPIAVCTRWIAYRKSPHLNRGSRCRKKSFRARTIDRGGGSSPRRA